MFIRRSISRKRGKKEHQTTRRKAVRSKRRPPCVTGVRSRSPSRVVAGGQCRAAASVYFSSSSPSPLPSSSSSPRPPRPRARRSRSPAAPRSPTRTLAAGSPRRSPRRRHSTPRPAPSTRNAWNCLRNGRPPLAALSWAPSRCGGAVVPRIHAAGFLAAARGRRVGFVGDSLSENLVVALLCALRSADDGARKWKRRGAWRGGYFPREDVVVAYHRAVLLAKYT
ncbi:hypothetical protein PR202_ga06264 [Eleusine coracana subsp. coracana]|uniref:Trichome birefringence-like C-terminal domain-containing protein n=1 Tax=Eleusine coracana subsp. coracana TaxID=191504 RepID=A0AAV5BW97_ELECO|nr:hypothetical protein PR202_ga06264 [Eleusine coracana subsp. coracana]